MKIRVGSLVLGIWAVLTTCGYTPSLLGDDAPKPSGYIELTDATEQHRCLRFEAVLRKWIPKLKLSDWNVTPICGVPEQWKDNSDGLHGASSVDVVHRVATVWFNPKSAKEPELVVVHELTHVIMAEVREGGSLVFEERAVYTVSELMYAGRDNN